MADAKSLEDGLRDFYAAQLSAPKAESPTALVTFRPLKSVAMAVHPDQIPEAMAHDKANGVPVDYTPHGRPIYTSAAQMRRHCKSLGYRHRGYA